MRANTRRNLIIGLFLALLITISIEFTEWVSISGTFDVLLSIIEISILISLAILIWLSFRDTAKYSEDRYRQIVETAHEGIWMVDKNNVTTFVNTRMCEMLGYTPEEMIGKDVFGFIDEKGQALARENIRRRKEGIAEELQFRFITKSGKEVWTQINSTPLFSDGVYEGALAMVTDITTRKRALDDIRRSNESFQLISRTTNDAVWEWNLDTNELWANERNQQLYGLTMLDPVPSEKLWAERIHPDDREKIIQRQKETLNSDKNVFISEYRFNTADKGYRDIYDRCYIVRNKEGKPIRMTGSMMDVTESKKVEAALKASEENLRQVLSSTADVFYVIDRDYRVTLINEIAAKNLKQVWGNPVYQGVDVLSVLPEDKKEGIKENYDRALKGENIEYDVANTVNGELSWVRVNYMPVSDQSGRIVGVYVVSKDITEKKLAEVAVKESEQRYRSLIEQASDFIMITDTNGNFIDANSSFIKTFGYSRSELVQLNINQVIDPEQLKIRPVRFDLLMKGQSILNERKMLTRSGEFLQVEANVKMLPDGRILAIARDIGERKKAEQALMTSEETRKLIMNAALDAIICIDLDGFITVWTPQSEKIFGWSEEEATGKRLSDLIIPFQYRKMHEEGLARYREKGEGPVLNRLMEITAINKQGKEFPIELSITPIRRGEFDFCCAFIRDITLRKQAQEEIRKSEERYRALVENATEALVVLDVEEKRFVNVSESAVNLFKLPKERLLQVGPLDLSPEYQPDGTPSVLLAVSKINQAIEGEKVAFEWEHIDATGKAIPCEIRLVRLPDNDRVLIRGSIIDITERKIAQLERRMAEEQLKKSEEKYRTLVEQAVDAIALYDEKGKILDVNTGSANLLGYSKEELMHMTLADVLTKEEFEGRPVRYDVLQKGESTVKQRLMRRKDGVIIETEVRSQQLPDGRFLSVIRDLSERIKAQKQIEEEKKLSDKLIDSLPGIFYSYDEHGRFLRWNHQFEVVTGYTGNEIASMHPLDFFDDDEKYYISERIGNVFKDGQSDAEADFVSRDGSKRRYYFKAVRIDYDNRPCLLGTGIDISDRKKAEKELETSNETLRKLTMHLQNIREEERSHIAREIHDELGQQLTVLKMDISWLNKKIESDDEKVQYRMKELVGMIDTTVRSVRKISSELRPSMLDDLGLSAALEWQGQEFEKRSGIKVKMSLQSSDLKLPNNIAITLFRIFQESCTNVARHSHATEMNVILRIVDQQLQMVITDNGQGFVVKGIENKKTLGILGMRERMTIINGAYNIESTPGKGTKVMVSVPLESIETY